MENKQTGEVQACLGCVQLVKSVRGYQEALRETTRLLAYVLSPEVDDKERTRIREALRKVGDDLEQQPKTESTHP